MTYEGPSWKHRRRLIYIAFYLGVGMIVFAGLSIVFDSWVGAQMVIGGVSLISIIITAYTGFATYEDARLYPRQQKPTEEGEHWDG